MISYSTIKINSNYTQEKPEEGLYVYEFRRERGKGAESVGAKEKIQRGIGAILYVSLCYDIFSRRSFSDPLSYQTNLDLAFRVFQRKYRRQWIATCTRASKPSLYTPHKSQFFFSYVSTVVRACASTRRRSIPRSKDGSPSLFFFILPLRPPIVE